MPRLLDGINSLAWQLIRQIDPAYPVAEQTFLAADGQLPLSAFENYIRGLVEDTPVERAKHLQEAVRIDPTYYPAWLALGRLYFREQEYELAAAAFGKSPAATPAPSMPPSTAASPRSIPATMSRLKTSFAFVACSCLYLR